MSNGYIYCFSNKSMQGIYKIGMTKRTVQIRLAEANKHDTFKPPTPYKIKFYKKVYDPKQKEKYIHILLSKYGKRVNKKREFFRVALEVVKDLFDLIDDYSLIDNSNIDKNEENIDY